MRNKRIGKVGDLKCLHADVEPGMLVSTCLPLEPRCTRPLCQRCTTPRSTMCAYMTGTYAKPITPPAQTSEIPCSACIGTQWLQCAGTSQTSPRILLT